MAALQGLPVYYVWGGGAADHSGGPLDIQGTHPPYLQGSWLMTVYMRRVVPANCTKQWPSRFHTFSVCPDLFLEGK